MGTSLELSRVAVVVEREEPKSVHDAVAPGAQGMRRARDARRVFGHNFREESVGTAGFRIGGSLGAYPPARAFTTAVPVRESGSSPEAALEARRADGGPREAEGTFHA